MVGEWELPWQHVNHNSMSMPTAELLTSTAGHMLGRMSEQLGVRAQTSTGY